MGMRQARSIQLTLTLNWLGAWRKSCPQNYLISKERREKNMMHLFFILYLVKACCLVAKSHGQLFCNTMDCSPPGSSVHGISQARVLECVTTSSSKGSSWPCTSGRFSTTEPPGKPKGIFRTIQKDWLSKGAERRQEWDTHGGFFHMEVLIHVRVGGEAPTWRHSLLLPLNFILINLVIHLFLISGLHNLVQKLKIL